MSLRNEGVNDAARFRNLLPRLKSHLARADQPSEFCGTGVRHSVFGDLHVTEDASIAAPLKTYDSWLNYESPAHCRSDSIFYSFYQATDDRLNNVTSVLCGLLLMILNQESSFLQLLRNSHEYSGAGKTFFQHVSSCDALGRMIVYAVNHECPYSTMLLIEATGQFRRRRQRGYKCLVSELPNQEVDSAAANVYINHEEDKLRVLRGYSLELSVTVISPLTQKTHSSRLLQFVISRLAFTEDTRRKALHNHNSLWAHYEGILTNIRECLDADYGSSDPQSLAPESPNPNENPVQDEILAQTLIRSIEEQVAVVTRVTNISGGASDFIHQSVKEFLFGRPDKSMPSGIEHYKNLVLLKLELTISRTLRPEYRLDGPGVRQTYPRFAS
ncbi:hypothetical protein CABS02_08184 [Colletotrichum abscissum]|uniref:Uncharacterized protein n=1 Tax=Colletotrichum abscissum TaxID=1671311 RepID=A0A9P9XCL2_9PEZI|nr:hypothetical protein CABS02_08184 [Colletotrichum abscissum]